MSLGTNYTNKLPSLPITHSAHMFYYNLSCVQPLAQVQLGSDVPHLPDKMTES